MLISICIYLYINSLHTFKQTFTQTYIEMAMNKQYSIISQTNGWTSDTQSSIETHLLYHSLERKIIILPLMMCDRLSCNSFI